MKWDFIKNLSHLVAVGNGSAELLQNALNLKPAKVTVFAVEESQVVQLQRQFASNANLAVRQAAVADANQSAEFYQYNLPELSAFSPATPGLLELFPGLKLQQKVELEAIEFAGELKVLGLTTNQNMLLLSTPAQNLRLLKHLVKSNQLGLFSAVVVQHSVVPFYTDAATLDELKAFFVSHDYQLAQTDNSDPDFPILQFCCDAQALELKQVKQKNVELTKQLGSSKQELAAVRQLAEQQSAELAKQLGSSKQELAAVKQLAEQHSAELTKQLDSSKQELAAAKQQAEQQSAQLTRQLATEKKQLEELKLQYEEAKKKQQEIQSWFENRKKQAIELEQKLRIANAELELLKGQQVTANDVEKLKNSMQELFANQTLQLQQATNALGQHVSNLQLEQQSNLQHFIGLQQFLKNGDPILASDRWAIPADTMLHIVKLINSNNYDLVIEFGSGQSTAIIAKTLANQNSELKQLVQANLLANTNKAPKQTELAPTSYIRDLPARVVSFEQTATYLNNTQQLLQEHGVAQFVDLQLAPLVPVAYAGQISAEPLFYNCGNKLAELARLFSDRQAKILVVVDGPVSPSKDPLIRYSALPAIINELAAHKLHLVLDDAKRDGEQQVLTHWQQLCGNRGLTLNVKQFSTTKGAALLEITP